MGGNPRKAILFEGPPGTGKTYMAKAMAREAGVPFLFVSSTAFQSMYYGQTGRKIRNYFKELRKAAREEGGAIGFIEEIDAIAGARSGMRQHAARHVLARRDPYGRSVERNSSEGISGVVNELLIQLQSFDTPTGGGRIASCVDRLGQPLPARAPAHLKKKPPSPSNILVIGATNRAADLDPALLRPGRFDRSIHFDLPSRSGRREIIDYYLDKKAHVPELDKEERRDALAAMTFGYTPVMIEHLFDEALVWALRDGRDADGLARRAAGEDDRGDRSEAAGRVHRRREGARSRRTRPVTRSVAYLVGQNRKLEVLSIIKRRDALGLLAHSDNEERFTRTRSELLGLDEDRVRRHDAPRSCSSASRAPVRAATSRTRRASRRRWSARSAWPVRSCRSRRSRPARSRRASSARCSPTRTRARRSSGCSTRPRPTCTCCSTSNRHLVIALRDELLEREELVGDEIVDVLHEAEKRARRRRRRRPAELRARRPVGDREKPDGGVRGAAGSLRPGCRRRCRLAAAQ